MRQGPARKACPLTQAPVPAVPASGPILDDRKIVRAILGVYLFFVIYASLFPFHLTLDGPTIKRNLHRAVLAPIDARGHRTFPRTDLAGNGLLGFPLGVLLMTSGLLRGPLGRRVVQVGIVSLGLGGSVEAMQLLTPDRTASAVDVGGQMVGALLGALGWHLLFRVGDTSIASGVLSTLRRRPSLGPACVLAAIMAMAALYPFTATLDARTVWQSFKQGAWIPLQAQRLPSWDVVVMSGVVPGALLGALVLSVFSRASLAARAGTWGLITGYGMALELAKLFIEGRSPNANDALAASVGALLGVGIGPAVARAPLVRAHRGAILTAAAAALLVYDELQPFRFRMTMTSLGSVEWLPFAYYYAAEPAGALLDVARKLLLGGLLGSALRVWGRPGPVIWTLGLAALLETLQLFVHSRHPAVTDILSLGVGAAIGAGIVVRYRALMAGTETGRGRRA